MRYFCITLLAIALLTLSGCIRSPGASPRTSPLAGVTVILDPGHGGVDPGARWTDSWSAAEPTEYFESAYTYRIAAELKQRLEKEGATVLLTVRSRVLDPGVWDEVPEGAPLPVPMDAVSAYGGVPIKATRDDQGLGQRTLLAQKAWKERSRLPDRERTTIFVSLHIDSRAADNSGGHVCVDSRRPIPALGHSVQDAMLAHGMDLWKNGTPAMVIDRRELWVLNPLNNPIPECVLVELATPGASIADMDRLASSTGRSAWVEMLCTAILGWRARTG